MAEARVTEAGLHVLPEDRSKPLGLKHFRGTVVAAGPGRWLRCGQRAPMPVKPGDVVVWGKYHEVERLMPDGERLLQVDAHDLDGVEMAE